MGRAGRDAIIKTLEHVEVLELDPMDKTEWKGVKRELMYRLGSRVILCLRCIPQGAVGME